MIRVGQPDSGAWGGRTFGWGGVQLIQKDPGPCPDDPGEGPDDPGRSNCSGFPLGDEFLGGNWMISGQKLRRFHGWKVGKLVGKLDPLETQRIHGSKSTKHHQTNKSQKKLGAIFGGGFRI